MDPSRPILDISALYGNAVLGCISLENCIPDGAMSNYMCNGICIPTFVPCNNTCLENVLWRTNRREQLFGPIICQDSGYAIIKPLVERHLGNLEGLCLFGYQQCNGTCIIDPRRPLYKVI